MEDGQAPTTMQRSRIRADARSGGGWRRRGHSQLATTADIYANVLPELQRDVAERMGSLLESIGAPS